MTFKLFLKPGFDAVFTINGRFSEGGAVILRRDEVYFITAFPLCAALLPYTVKLVFGKVASNPDLASIATTANGEGMLVLKPRYAFVYSGTTAQPENIPLRFFEHIKNGELDRARDLLTPDLSSAVDNDMLTGFFDGYSALVPDNDECCFLLTDEGKAEPYRFKLLHGKIDDVTEL